MAKQRTALVTGGNRGIGLAVCRGLGQLGLKVVMGCRRPDEGEKEAEGLRKEGVEIRVEKIDISSEISVRDCAKSLAAAGWEVDALVNNAGVYPQGSALSVSSADFRSAMDINCLGALWACRAFMPKMLERGYGRVVNVTSGYGLFSEGLASAPAAYGVSKAALDALTVVLAAEAPGLKINACCPGWVRTRMGGKGAPRSPEKGAETIVWLATLADDGPTGQVFRDKEALEW